jgi:hypothetical protein
MALESPTNRTPATLCARAADLGRLAGALVALGCSPSGAASHDLEQGGASQRQGGASQGGARQLQGGASQGGACQLRGGASGGPSDAGTGGGLSSSGSGGSPQGGGAQSGGQSASGESGASSGGTSGARVCGSDPECNDDPSVSSLWGHCLQDGRCSCSVGHVLNPRSGKCAISKGSVLNSTAGWGVVGEVAVAARADEAAVVYVEENETRARVLLQRFDVTGTFFGDSFELASAPPGTFSSLAIASNAQKYLVCWAGAAEINCRALAEVLESTPGLHAEGRAVAVVYGSRSWLVGYASNPVVGQPTEFFLRSLDDDFAPLSPTASFVVAGSGSSYDPIPLLARTDSDFVLVASDPAQADRAHLYRLDAELTRLGAPIDLGYPFWFTGRVTANGHLAAVSLAKPYASNLILADTNGVVQSLEIRGGGKTGMHQALLADDAGLVASWFTSEPELHTEVFASGAETPELPAGTPTSLALVRIGERVLGVYSARPAGPANSEWGGRVEGIAVRDLSPN